MKKHVKFINEFKEFISRGNVIDMAVGIIMGTAFTAIVNSLVNQVVMPFIGFLIKGVNFTDLKIILSPAEGAAEEVAIHYGSFIQNIISFIIVSFVVFCMVKFINLLRRKEAIEEAIEEAAETTPEETLLLREIRDLLKKD